LVGRLVGEKVEVRMEPKVVAITFIIYPAPEAHGFGPSQVCRTTCDSGCEWEDRAGPHSASPAAPQ
jgi:hypothetical protein